MNKDQMLLGIDVYHGNSIDWSAQLANGAKFAYIKATEGSNYEDPMLGKFFDQARPLGIACGPYHFFRPTDDVTTQIQALADCMKKIGGPHLPPALDLEWCGKNDDWKKISPKMRVQKVNDALGAIYDLTGHHTMLYCGDSWVQEDLGGSLVCDKINYARLWLADVREHYVLPAPFTTFDFWQYGEDAAGVDLDRYNGDLTTLSLLNK